MPSRPAWCDLTGGFLSLCSVSPLHLSLRAGVRERPVRECGDAAWPLVPRVYSVPEDVGPGKGGHPVRGPGASWGTHGPCAGRRGAWWPEACRPRGAGPLRLHGGRGVPGLEKRRMPLAQKPQGRGRPSGLLWSQNEGGQPLASHWPPRRPSLAGRLSAVAEPWPRLRPGLGAHSRSVSRPSQNLNSPLLASREGGSDGPRALLGPGDRRQASGHTRQKQQLPAVPT